MVILTGNAEGIVDYQAWQEMGRTVSPSIVEKTVELLVARRCKHQGMVWSRDGVDAVALPARSSKTTGGNSTANSEGPHGNRRARTHHPQSSTCLCHTQISELCTASPPVAVAFALPGHRSGDRPHVASSA
jgi:hypothetical protein